MVMLLTLNIQVFMLLQVLFFLPGMLFSPGGVGLGGDGGSKSPCSWEPPSSTLRWKLMQWGPAALQKAAFDSSTGEQCRVHLSICLIARRQPSCVSNGHTGHSSPSFGRGATWIGCVLT